MLEPLKATPSVGNLLSATVIGFTAITLFGRAGELVRPYLIARKEGVSLSSQLAMLLLERMFDLLMALLLFGFALARVNVSGMAVGPKLASILAVGGKLLGFVGLVLLLVLLSFRHLAEPARRRLTDALRFLPEHQFLKAESLIAAFAQGVESTRSDAALIRVLFYSVIEWAFIVACYWCVVQAFSGFSITFIDLLIFLGFVAFGAVIQLPGIGGGIQVASVLVLTELFGTRLETATAFAFIIWIMTFVVIVPAGLLVALREGLHWNNLRQIGREAPL
jgi:glycosyltransferase 2 family protein